MNRSELVKSIAEQADVTPKEADKFLVGFMETVKSTLAKGESVAMVGFGTFEVATRAARTGRNPKTGKEISIPETVAPKFKPGKTLKEAVAEGQQK